MKIERINENQIRCTLSNFDLSVRNVNLNELAYGSEKARNLFREMIQRASREVGFEAEDIPLMIAGIVKSGVVAYLEGIRGFIPASKLDLNYVEEDALNDWLGKEIEVRVITADEDDDPSVGNLTAELLDGADALLSLLGSQNPGQGEGAKAAPAVSDKNAQAQKAAKAPDGELPDPARYIRFYQFDSLDQVCAAARETGSVFSGSSVLYKNPQSGRYYLVLKKESSDELSFSRTCNLLSEYGTRLRQDPAAEAYYAEHYEVIVKQNTLAALAKI